MEYNGHKFKELTFDYQLESWKKNKCRIEAINNKGYEDYTGYGSLTDGRKNRFYIGKSDISH